MDQLRQYALGIIAGAIVTGILVNLVQDSAHKELLRILCGIFLSLLVLRPVAGPDGFPDMTALQEAFEQGSREAQAGNAMAREEQFRRITAGVEAYILDKADREGAELKVEVTLGEDFLPKTAVLHGRVSPQIKSVLSRMLEQELGITKENQLWTG